jgi:hypothetical protein
MDKFQKWRVQVTRQMLDIPQWVQMLEDVARRQAESEEEAARKMQNAKWLSWLHDGPAAGLGRQHLISRSAIGWNPTADSVGDDSTLPPLADPDGIDGLSSEELRSIKEQRTEAGCPANAQQEVDDEATGWGKQWQTGQRYVEPDWQGIGLEVPDALLQHELVTACQTFPANTGLGWDALHPRAVARLSTSTLVWIISILRQCELTGDCPTCIGSASLFFCQKMMAGTDPSASSLGWSECGCEHGGMRR